MKVKRYIYIFLFLGGFNISCVSPPDDFPAVPQISFNSLGYIETNSSDSLVVSVDFRDAEGDLGLSPREVEPPFHPLDYQTDAEGNLITYGIRPPDAPSFNNRDWVINPLIDNTEVKDTIWVKINPDQYNIFIKFYIKRGGDYSEYDFAGAPFYSTFNGRFPRILAEDRDRAIEGTVKYSMLSLGWNSVFRNDTIRIDVQIQDRALNKSNVVSSPDFTLSQITR
ncbi:MAG: hypothetical protein WD426_10120 [Anditalea sp.]